jgi:N-acetylglutamate synthase-like GNAT family acetyltransferase
VERWAEFVKDGRELFPEHYAELARDQERIKLDINEDLYVDADNRGIGHIATVRDEGKLVGYTILAVMPHLHYKSAGPMAMIDVYYLKPAYRKGGTGAKMIMFAESTLKAKGVTKIYFSTKVHLDNGKLLEALGFKFSDKVYTKLLE